MTSIRLAVPILAFFVAFESRAAPIAAVEAEMSFETLKRLEGDWTGTAPSGRNIRVTYRSIAAGSTLVETWALGPGRVSMTVYHMDNDRLIATHYCPLGNQPRLLLSGHDGRGSFEFSFLDATGLTSAVEAHQDSFRITMHGADTFARSETYIENGERASEIIQFQRVSGADR
ncbi:hypothetical protein RCO27_08315 [Sphingosinicella sp. LHD-64]|uniref:hypothetical protein n=1 Tax=Sphingosinicella sp. LHD-64 TaxID=3072139 RepID=UPI00280CC60D|nr:hypothetical protein [Sphingosinicella sp. LHD-64]MDQ8756235.1 hypothetical protein [Sphingosinicella sp. LHD-64]